MPKVLLVAEKPSVAGKLAKALGNYSVFKNYGVTNYKLDTELGELIIAPAVGHMYSLEQKSDGWDYPVFDVEWVPAYESDNSAKYVKKYVNNMKKVAEGADYFINGCDFDIEGSVIGFNAIKFSGGDDAEIKRMKFSTLTDSDLQEAFNNLNEFDSGQTEAGITRHVLDWYYGINLSRALINAVKSQNRYKSLSTGRVQGPALKVLADKERDIEKFEPEDYWEIYLYSQGLEAQHVEDKFWDEEKAKKVVEICGDSDAVVASVNRRKYKHNPPVPFNLTGLQKAAYRQFNINPKQTQQIAHNLYESSLISYPRTSSQKLPAKLGYKSIITKLKKQDDYEELAGKLLDMKKLSPRQGKKKDEAHPAIHPTGLAPSKNLSKKERKVYDLIVKRFFATFGKPAVRQSLKIRLDVNGEEFDAKGKKTLERNWYNLYEPYVKTKEVELRKVEKGQKISVDRIEMVDKETQPPKRFTQSSLVSELEKKELGTKATRAQIVDSLYNRKYIKESSLKVTDLGMAVVESLEENCPEILSPELTRNFEEEMERIRNGDTSREDVLKKAEDTLKEVLKKFKDREEEIGKGLVEAVDSQRKRENQLGPCQECENGTLRIIRTKNGRFVGCSSYPECDNSYPLPRKGKIKGLKNACEECGKPRIKVSRKGRKPYYMCIDPDCPTKDDWD